MLCTHAWFESDYQITLVLSSKMKDWFLHSYILMRIVILLVVRYSIKCFYYLHHQVGAIFVGRFGTTHNVLLWCADRSWSDYGLEIVCFSYSVQILVAWTLLYTVASNPLFLPFSPHPQWGVSVRIIIVFIRFRSPTSQQRFLFSCYWCCLSVPSR